MVAARGCLESALGSAGGSEPSVGRVGGTGVSERMYLCPAKL